MSAVPLPPDRGPAPKRAVRPARLRLFRAVLFVGVIGCVCAGGWYFNEYLPDREMREAREARHVRALEQLDHSIKMVALCRSLCESDEAGRYAETAAQLAVGHAPERVAELEALGADLAFARRLDAIRYHRWEYVVFNDGGWTLNYEFVAPQYRRAFGERGLDVLSADPERVAATIRASAIRRELVAALDDWARAELFDDRAAARVWEVARRADPHPWTDRYRDPAVRRDREAVRQLASDPIPPDIHAATLSGLIGLLRAHEFDPFPLLQRAHARFSQDADLALHLSESLTPEGLRAAEAATRLRPHLPAAWVLLGVNRRAQGDPSGAVVALRRAVELAPQFGLARSQLGQALHASGDHEGAIAELRRALALWPKSGGTHAHLGRALAAHGDRAGAIAAFRRATDLDPLVGAHAVELARQLRATGDSRGAAEAMRRGVRHSEVTSALRCELADVLYEAGELFESAKAYRELFDFAEDKSPVLAAGLRGYSRVLRDLGKPADARRALERAAEIDPKWLPELKALPVAEPAPPPRPR